MMDISGTKYSLIIPVRNGGKYLPVCIETIISQNYENYELIISDDHSEDGTKDYLKDLKHKNIKIFEPPTSLSMSEHWEWALSHASGEWNIFIGQDDGLQPYFFDLADRLTAIADKKNIRVIMSGRAYFFWPGCEFVYGKIAVRYYAMNKIKVHHSGYEALKALMGIQPYFELPEMYTTSLFHRNIIEEARKKQLGKVLVTHPQDANLAAIACSLERRYLKSYIPLGWVGSSPKSAGLAVCSSNYNLSVKEGTNDWQSLKIEYESKVKKSSLEYHRLAGEFAFDNASIYFWQSLLQTGCLRTKILNILLLSKTFRTIMLSSVFIQLRNSKTKISDSQWAMFMNIVNLNRLNFTVISFLATLLRLLLSIRSLLFIFYRIQRKITTIIFANIINYNIYWPDEPDMTMIEASNKIRTLVAKKRWIFNHIYKKKKRVAKMNCS